MRLRGDCCRWLCVGAALLMSATALLCALLWPSIFDYALSKQLLLAPGSKSYDGWEAPTVPLFFDVYLFNWTNPEKFPAEVPNLEQVGPYRFSEQRRHVNVTFHCNGTLSYRTHRVWHHSAAGSNASLDDNVTTINMIAASAVYRSRNWPYLKQRGLSLFLSLMSEGVSVTRPARQLLFEGYEDPMLDLAKSMPSEAEGAPPVDKFGWFYGRNDTVDTDGEVQVTTGEDGLPPGQVRAWNRLPHLPFYNEECNQLFGSAGEFLPRRLPAEAPLPLFVPELCRALRLPPAPAAAGTALGLPYMQYKLDIEQESDGSCHCGGDCLWRGTLNVSACRYDSPAVISLPHLLRAAPAARDMVRGMQPDEHKHAFYINAQTELGVPLDVAARFQLNVYLDANENIDLYKDMPRMIFPVFWVEQRVTVSEGPLAEQLRMARRAAVAGAPACLTAAAVAAALAAAAACCRRKRKPKKKDEAEVKLNPTITK